MNTEKTGGETFHAASLSGKVEELTWRYDADGLVFLERQQATVSGVDERGATLERGGNILVVIRILADAGRRFLAGHEIGQHNDILEPELGLDIATDEFADLRVRVNCLNASRLPVLTDSRAKRLFARSFRPVSG